MKIGDGSDIMYVSILGEYPGTEIMGMTAQELRALAETDQDFQGWDNIQDLDLSTISTIKDHLEKR